MVDMYTACTPSIVKQTILNSFVKKEGKLRVIICTVAFGMGVDCASVLHVIHWGPPADTESYIQETGCAGRDSITSYASLYYSKTEIAYNYIEDSIKKYCRNKHKHIKRCNRLTR